MRWAVFAIALGAAGTARAQQTEPAGWVTPVANLSSAAVTVGGLVGYLTLAPIVPTGLILIVLDVDDMATLPDDVDRHRSRWTVAPGMVGRDAPGLFVAGRF
jgi:hypothetical protein